MTRTRRNQINRLADMVRNGCANGARVDVDQIVTRLGGSLETEADAEFEARVEKVTPGFRITLARQENERRRRFSVAHELGHLFLHMGYLVDEAKWEAVGQYTDSVYYRFGFSTEESEANEFAGALLMPRDEFSRIAYEHLTNGVFDVQAIADQFEVSKDAAVTRGRWLGLFTWD